MDFVVVDIETTGLAPDINEIIEIGAVRLQKKDGDYAVTARYSQLVKPYNEIPPVVRSLTGISAKTVEQAPRFKEVAGAFREFVGDAVFVAHNALFDLRMINASFERLAQEPLRNPCLDTQDMVAIAFPAQPSHRLGDLVKNLNIETTDALHRALADAEATARLLLKTMEAIAALPPAVSNQMGKLLKHYQGVEKDVLAELKGPVRAAGSWKNAIARARQFERSVYLRAEEKSTALPAELAAQYFAPAGKFQDFPHYEYRPQQKEMAAAIIEAFNNEQHLMLEAGTGTGKSAAYLVAALLWIKQNGGPLIVSTRTKNLQDQLVDKDIPAVLKLFPEDNFQIMILKGRQNYVCLRRFEALVQHLLLSRSKEISKILPLFTWLISTAEGDLSELHSSIEKKYSRQINSEGLGCPGEACPDHHKCFLQQARRQARHADLIVGNHALVFTDLARESGLLPGHRQIILDEAHTLEEAVTESWSLAVNYGFCADELKKLEQQIRTPEFLSLAGKFRADAREYFEELSRVGREQTRSGEDRALRIRDLKKREALWRALELVRLSAAKQLKKLQQLIDEYMDAAGEDADIVQIRNSKVQLQKLWGVTDTVAAEKDNYVAWLAWQNGKPPFDAVLRAAPVDVGRLLQDNLFAVKKSVIMVSATLTINNSFAYFAGRFGFAAAPETLRQQQLGSPYNYREQMLCLLPDDLTAAGEKEYHLKAAEYLAKLAEITAGRMLVLFTSYRSLELTYRYFRALVEEDGLMVYCQGLHGSRRSLVSRFRSGKNTVLFGTSSFWEGVDIQGEALSSVVIFKLPFAVPSEPVTQARSEEIEARGGSSFFEYSLPQAVIRFKQGVGRLIRGQKDRGIITIIDERIFTKNYGKSFIRSMPECELLKAPSAETIRKAREWF
ncbi:MAG: 3'-5' exoribonuclease [Candidatus Margulisbacteria bacterium]|jgi:ATP-dependent DNA helicase DinG|nr:3'-5' exoribonuclease [Candidatus Margulisiibacteriota bacterium]